MIYVTIVSQWQKLMLTHLRCVNMSVMYRNCCQCEICLFKSGLISWFLSSAFLKMKLMSFVVSNFFMPTLTLSLLLNPITFVCTLKKLTDIFCHLSQNNINWHVDTLTHWQIKIVHNWPNNVSIWLTIERNRYIRLAAIFEFKYKNCSCQTKLTIYAVNISVKDVTESIC